MPGGQPQPAPTWEADTSSPLLAGHPPGPSGCGGPEGSVLLVGLRIFGRAAQLGQRGSAQSSSTQRGRRFRPMQGNDGMWCSGRSWTGYAAGGRFQGRMGGSVDGRPAGERRRLGTAVKLQLGQRHGSLYRENETRGRSRRSSRRREGKYGCGEGPA
ncbi:hypothetical protein VPH35_063095 [Triticum aestivum]